MKRKGTLFVLLLSILLSIKISAEEIDIGKIEVVDSYEDDCEKSSQPEKFTTIITIDDEDEGKNAAEILSESPEVFIKDTGGEAGISTVSIRGSSSKNVLILLDGTPLNTGGNSSIDISMIPAGSIERIEVIRGGDAALYGSGAMGGVINIITKQPDKKFYKYTLEGTAFRAFNTIFSAGEKTKSFDIFFSLHYTYDLGNFIYQDNNGTEFNKEDDSFHSREHNNAEKISFLLNHRLFLPKDMILGFTLNYNTKSNSIGGPLTFENHFINAHLNTNLLNTGINFNLGNLNPLFTSDFSINLKHDSYNYSNPREYGGSPFYSEQSLVYLKTKIHNQIFALPSNILHIIGEGSFETMENAPSRIESALVLRDEFYSPDETIGVLPTARLQYNSDLNEPLRLLWNMGLFILPIEYLKIKLNAFHAFRNPDFYELYYTYGQYIGNPELKPEVSYGGDLGLHFKYEHFFIEGVFFITDYIDLIQYLLSYGFVYKPMNIDNALSLGGEFRCRWNIIDAFALHLSYTLNYLSNCKNIQEGLWTQLPGHPRQTFVGKLEYRNNNFTLGGQLKFEDTISITQNGFKYIPAKILIDLSGKMVFEVKKRNLKGALFINLNNILDVHTLDIRNYPLEGFKLDMGFCLEF